MFTMRFDMRAPHGPETVPGLYRTAVEMAEWADTRGCAMVVLSEHHGSPDGYLPSPFLLAAAMSARTSTVHFTIAAAPILFYDPVRLAEEIAVLDNMSRGRLSVVLVLGYRPEEFDMFGIDMSHRARKADEYLEVLTKAMSGRPFEHDGRRIWVTPAPTSEGGPKLSYGGRTTAAARRAARLAWSEIGEYLLHDAVSYAQWNPDDDSTVSLSCAKTVGELREMNGAHRILTVSEARQLLEHDGYVPLHPLCGGMPPEVAWPYFRRIEEVLAPG